MLILISNQIDIIRPYFSQNYFLFVEEINQLQQLSNILFGFIFCEILFLLDCLKQFLSLQLFHYQIVLIIILNTVVILSNIRMVYLFVSNHFKYQLLSGLVVHFIFFKYFHHSDRFSNRTLDFINRPILSDPQFIDHFVMFFNRTII